MAKKSNNNQPLTAKIRQGLWLAVFAGVMLLGYLYLGQYFGAVYEQKRSGVSVTDGAGSSSSRVITNLDLGGDFTLINQQGDAVSSADLHGQWQIVYFGYTFCPDICPMELQTITNTIQQLPVVLAERVQPVFITVDPERDTVDVLASYMGLFDDRFIGLTGTPEQVRQAMAAYRVFANKVDDGQSAVYLVDHSTFTYVVNPAGQVEALFRYPVNADELAAFIIQAMQQSAEAR